MRWICRVCSHRQEGDAPPDRCPTCGVDSGEFRKDVEGNDAPAEAASARGGDERAEDEGAAGGDVPEKAGDGGVRTGFEVLEFPALGATAVMIGRDAIRATIGGGSPGVATQMERLGSVLRKAMLMTGCPDLASIDRSILR